MHNLKNRYQMSALCKVLRNNAVRLRLASVCDIKQFEAFCKHGLSEAQTVLNETNTFRFQIVYIA